MKAVADNSVRAVCTCAIISYASISYTIVFVNRMKIPQQHTHTQHTKLARILNKTTCMDGILFACVCVELVNCWKVGAEFSQNFFYRFLVRIRNVLVLNVHLL